MRKVFLDDLPRWGKGGKAKEGNINWKESIGYKVKFIYDDISGEIEIFDYNSNKQTLSIRLSGKSCSILTGSLQKCRLGKLLGKITNSFRINIGDAIKDNKRDLIILNREYKKDSFNRNWKILKYKCNNCGWDKGQIRESDLLNGQGCPCCSVPIKKVVLGINTIWDTDRYLVDLGVSEEDAKKYTKGSHKRITVKCPDCKKEKSVIICDLVASKSIGCPCGDGYSYGHKYIHQLLIQVKYGFADNYKPEWCKYYNKYKNKEVCGEYDFFIENMKLIIEVDGEFHRKDNNMNGQVKEESRHIDSMKDKLAKENGYKIIRIPYGEGVFKENILNSGLAKIADLSQVDWDKCEKFATSNLVKEICDYWNNKEEWETTKHIADVFILSKSSVINYLKRGNAIRWCNFNPQHEMKKWGEISGAKIRELKAKPVEVFKDYKSIGSFKSMSELSKMSEKLLGFKVYTSQITKACEKERKDIKGFTFKYID